MAEGGPDERTPLIPGGDSIAGDVHIGAHSYTTSGGNNLFLSPGGRSLVYTAMAGQQRRDQISRGQGSGRMIPINRNRSRGDEEDPLRDVRAEMPYNSLVEHIPDDSENVYAVRTAAHTQSHRERYYSRLQNLIINAFGVEYNAHRENMNSSNGQAPTAEPREQANQGEEGGDPENQPQAASTQQTPLPFGVKPDHLVPAKMFELHVPILYQAGAEESSDAEAQSDIEVQSPPGRFDSFIQSAITIGAIWNTMIGTSLLAMPWAMELSGYILGPLVSCIVGFFASFTATRILVVNTGGVDRNPAFEFAELCGQMLGPAYEPIVGICSLGAVLGAAIVYWVLMSNFLYSSVVLAYDKITGAMHGHPEQYALICAISPDRNATEIANPSQGNSGYPIYPMPPFVGPLPAVFPDPEASSFFDTYWTHKSVAFYLSGGVLPLITWAKPGFLQKFNCIGTLNIFVLIGVVIYFASEWGINVEFHDIASPMYIPWGSGTVYCLSGTLSMGMFIHNAIITITSRQGARKENNVRDTKIAFALVLISYLLIGVLFYLSFPLPKNCIADNFLNNFHTNNPIMAVCRVFLLFQLVTVFPIIMLILRNQVLSLMPTVSQDNNTLITFINVSTCGFCVFIAIIYPNIGNIIRYSGAACGMIMMFVAPCLCHMMYMREESQVHPMAIILEVVIICAGVLNFVAQFLPLSWFG